MKVISSKNKPIFIEIILLLIRQNTIPYGQRHYIINAFDLMEFCLVIDLKMDGNRVVMRHQYLLLGVLV